MKSSYFTKFGDFVRKSYSENPRFALFVTVVSVLFILGVIRSIFS